jgi:hypothetical protein
MSDFATLRRTQSYRIKSAIHRIASRLNRQPVHLRSLRIVFLKTPLTARNLHKEGNFVRADPLLFKPKQSQAVDLEIVDCWSRMTAPTFGCSNFDQLFAAISCEPESQYNYYHCRSLYYSVVRLRIIQAIIITTLLRTGRQFFFQFYFKFSSAVTEYF